MESYKNSVRNVYILETHTHKKHTEYRYIHVYRPHISACAQMDTHKHTHTQNSHINPSSYLRKYQGRSEIRRTNNKYGYISD